LSNSDILVSLNDLLESWGRDDTEMLLRTFRCEREPEIEEFLKQKAISFHEKHLSRTYLILSDDKTEVLAYVTLSIKCLEIPENNSLSRSIEKRMNVFKGVSQCYLIGQLCKADGAERGMGTKLIGIAISKIGQSFETVGCRTVRVDCKKDLVGFYEKHGFCMVSQKSNGDDLYYMVLLL